MKRPNILFILVDALRANSLSCYGYNRKTSPNIDYLAKKGIFFKNAFCTVNATDPSLTTIFSGLYPDSHGILHHGDQIKDEEISLFKSRNIKLLPEILKNNRYKTFGLDWLGRWHRQGYDYYAGFNVDRVKRKKTIKNISKFLEKLGLKRIFKKIYYSQALRALIGKFDLYNEDKNLTDQAVDIIDKYDNDSPFFMFIHYWGLHAPYNCPKKYVEEFRNTRSTVNIQDIKKSFDGIKNEKYRKFYENWTKDEKSFYDIIVRHDGAIRQIDDQIGLILSKLKEKDKLDNTLIIITSDHGESLVEHNIFFDHHGLYDASINVPLIISYPKILARGKQINSLIQHTDITPTILELTKIKNKIDFDGYSLTSLINKNKAELRNNILAFENYYQDKECIRSLEWKLIKSNGKNICSRCGISHGEDIELYNIKGDPGELDNLAAKNKKMLKVMLNALNKHKKMFSKNRNINEAEILNKAITDIKI